MKVLLILNKYRSQLLTFMAIVGPTSCLGQNTEEKKYQLSVHLKHTSQIITKNRAPFFTEELLILNNVESFHVLKYPCQFTLYYFPSTYVSLLLSS